MNTILQFHMVVLYNYSKIQGQGPADVVQGQRQIEALPPQGTQVPPHGGPQGSQVPPQSQPGSQQPHPQAGPQGGQPQEQYPQGLNII